MKLLTFKRNNEVNVGVKSEKGILDLKAAGNHFNMQISDSMLEIIRNNELSEIKKLVDLAETDQASELFVKEEEIEYLPSILNPEKVLCVGLNYLSHIEEAKDVEVPPEPVLFSKFNNSLAAHNEDIPLPKAGEKFDYEAELVLVIGKEAKDVKKEEALSYVWGYTVGNDLSVRDLQFKSGGQWLLGKSPDKFAPFGPHIVTPDELDASNLDIELKVNGEVRQSSNTKHMIFDIATIISYASQHMTLKPGDIIFTGTPEGVILGYEHDKQIWLKAGDEVEVSIEGIGTLKNTLK